MSAASEVMAKPTTSARISAPRARACSHLLEHEDRRPLALHHAVAVGRERAAGVRDITRSPSQAFTPPKQSIDSEPPVTITRLAPTARSWKAWPIAWFDEAQAVATVKDGPLRLYSMLTWLAAALFISFGTTKGWTRFFPSS